ncbi:MAG: hypothetical protein ABL997_07265 [Planctomycetota bacterium]
MRAGLRIIVPVIALAVMSLSSVAAQESLLATVFDEEVPTFAVVGFYANAAEAAVDGAWLLELQRRHEAVALRCAAVTAEELAEPLPKALSGLLVRADERGALRSKSIGLGERGPIAIFCRGEQVAVIDPAHGVFATVAAVVAGTFDAAGTARSDGAWQELRHELADLSGAAATAALELRIRERPTCGDARGVLFAAQRQKLADRTAAAATAKAAVAALANEPRALAAFVSLSLRSCGRDVEFATTLLEPLAAAASAQPSDLRLQLARLRALVAAGEGREVGRLAHQLARGTEYVPALALEFVEILTGDPTPEVHKDLAARVMGIAAERGADPRTLSAVRFLHALRCEGDPQRAREVAVEALEREPGRVSINNEAWRWLTDVETAGRFDAFALALVERMLEQKAALEFFECDTAAMAMFRNGRVREAIELQQLAIDRGGAQPIYLERLQGYQQALRPATPR